MLPLWELFFIWIAVVMSLLNINTLTTIHFIMHHQRKPRQELKAGTWRQELELRPLRNSAYQWNYVASSGYLLIQPRTAQEWYCPQWDRWAMLITNLGNAWNASLLEGSLFSLWFLFPEGRMTSFLFVSQLWNMKIIQTEFTKANIK